MATKTSSGGSGRRAWLSWPRLSRLLGFLAALAAVVAWTVLLRPQFLGGPVAYNLVSGSSMEPALHGGDLVLARRQDTYHLGDIVAFRTEGGDVIHRIVGGSAQGGFITQGDNRDGFDHWRPRPKDIFGKKWLRIPGGGHVVVFLRSPIVLAALAGSTAAFLVLRGERKKTRAPQVSPSNAAGREASRCRSIRSTLRLRLPPGPTLFLLLALLLIGVAGVPFGPRSKGWKR